MPLDVTNRTGFTRFSALARTDILSGYATISPAMTYAELVEVDAIGLVCPMPLLKAKRALNGMDPGQRLRVRATDQGSVRDFQVFAQQ